MAPSESLSDKLISFIHGSFIDDGTRITADTPLLDLHIIDSASLFDMVDYIRQQFSVRIPVHEVHPGNFGSVSSLAQLIDRLHPVEENR